MGKEYTYNIGKYTIGVDTNGEDGIGLTVAIIENDKINFLGSCYGDNARCIDLLIRENQELKRKINVYENPNDLTSMFMYCDGIAKDTIKELEKQLQIKEDGFKATTEELCELAKENEELANLTLGYLIGYYKTHEETIINKDEIEAIDFIIEKK